MYVPPIHAQALRWLTVVAQQAGPDLSDNSNPSQGCQFGGLFGWFLARLELPLPHL